ncbi:MAG: hypothetical protein ACOY99_06145 [Pseudomonadota bacterium]
MKTVKTYWGAPFTAVLWLASSAAWSADSPKLAAPVYQGAVPGVPAEGLKVDPIYVGNFGGMKTLDCQATTESHDITGRPISAKEAQQTGQFRYGPWCFLSRDPIDKVKAFYDKIVGPMHVINGTWGRTARAAVQGYEVLAERAWFPGDGESPPGFYYRGVSLHALPLPGRPGREAKNSDDSWEGQEAYRFYAGSRHFNGFLDAVDWFGDPSKRKPAELNVFYEKHKQLESALFQRKGSKMEEVDETLRARFSEKRKQAEQKAMALMPGHGQEQMSQAQMMQMARMGQTAPVKSGGTPEDAEFSAFMKKNPTVANRYVELTTKINSLMQQGKFDEADAADEELQKLIDANPELAALERRADERAATASAAGQAQETQAIGKYQKAMDQAIWDTWREYIDAAEKEAYYTLIVIDNGLRGDEKGYSRDQAVIAEDARGWVSHQGVWGFAYDSQQGTKTSDPVTSETKPKTDANKKEDAGNAVKKGLKNLKKLF